MGGMLLVGLDKAGHWYCQVLDPHRVLVPAGRHDALDPGKVRWEEPPTPPS